MHSDSKSSVLVSQFELNPLRYIFPYLITYDVSSTTCSMWTLSTDANPLTLYATLEGNFAQPWSQYILPSNHLLTEVDVNVDSSMLIAHHLPSGVLIDHLVLGPTSFVPTPAGEGALLGVIGDNIAVWRNDGPGSGNGYINIYTLTPEGKFSMINTVRPPSTLPTLELSKQPVRYRPPQLIYLSRDLFIGSSYHCDFPTSSHISRWSSDNNTLKCATFNFANSTLPFEDAIMHSTLEDHVAISSQNAVVVAYYEHPLETNNTANSTTCIRSINVETLQANWSISIAQHVDVLRYNASMNIILAFGVGAITILDCVTGVVMQTHAIRKPQLSCGPVMTSKMGCYIDLTPSGEYIVAVFGDGQLATAKVEEFVAHGFPSPADGASETVATLSCPELLAVAFPKNSKQRKEKERGVWKWVRQAFILEGQVVLEREGPSGFVILSWM